PLLCYSASVLFLARRTSQPGATSSEPSLLPVRSHSSTEPPPPRSTQTPASPLRVIRQPRTVGLPFSTTPPPPTPFPSTSHPAPPPPPGPSRGLPPPPAGALPSCHPPAPARALSRTLQRFKVGLPSPHAATPGPLLA